MRLRIYINNVTLILAAILPVLASAAKEKEPEYVTPTAWTVSEPLGLRYESTVDTLFENYHAGAVPSLLSKAWATTGNYGAEGQNQIFFERKPISQFFFADAQQAWLPSLE
ncbi:MAG: hypothetical protein IK092_02490, partial [Muribaculaceae bacterium]|nr:hypothetical protein [Muribaculaceae bacterium]